MASMVSWLSSNINSYQPTKAVALNATRHMNKIEQKKLFSPDIEHMRTAEGKWYEATIYEMFLDITLESDHIQGIALKGADAPRTKKVRLGQNGLFYSRGGSITIRGNGQDLAEFDLLLLEKDGSVAFSEVITSTADLKDFEKEVEYKKRLLGYIFGQEKVSFLLVSPFDITNYSVGRRLMRSPENINIKTMPCEVIKSHIIPHKTKMSARKPREHPKLMRAPDIPIKNSFDYEVYHNRERNRIFQNLSKNGDHDQDMAPDEGAELVKKILFGAMYPSGIRELCRHHDLKVNGSNLTYHNLIRQYSKAILAADLPDYDLLVYLKPKSDRRYLKMVQNKSGNFKFERFTPPKVGFYLWLESLNPALGSRATGKILSAFSPKRKI